MEKLFTVKDLMQIGFGRDVAYQLMHNKSFPSIKVGGRYYIEPQELQKWLQQNRYKNVIL